MRKFLRKFNAEDGVTIVEMLVYIGIASIVTVVVAGMMQTTTVHYQNNQNRLELKQDIRAAMNMITKDLRMAGCDPDPDDDNDFGLVVADAQSIQVTGDFLPSMSASKVIGGITVTNSRNYIGDNKATSPGENVSYFLDSGNLVRRALYEDGAWHTEIVLENVTDLQFNYLSAPGSPATLVNSTTIEGAYFVEVVIEAESSILDRNTGQPISMKSSSMIYMRNMGYRQT